jgi:hypothetical protein
MENKIFTIFGEEQETLDEWMEEHNRTCEIKLRNQMRSFQYCFTPVGIGTVIEVKCSCGESVDITNIDSW